MMMAHNLLMLGEVTELSFAFHLMAKIA